MSLNASKSKLAGLTRELLGKWDQTRATWADAKGLEFETNYIEELRSSVDNAFNHIEALDKILAKVRSDCE